MSKVTIRRVRLEEQSDLDRLDINRPAFVDSVDDEFCDRAVVIGRSCEVLVERLLGFTNMTLTISSECSVVDGAGPFGHQSSVPRQWTAGEAVSYGDRVHSMLCRLAVPVVVLSLTAACGDDSASQPASASTTAVSSTTTTPSSTTTSEAPDLRDGRPFEVTTMQLSLVDASRPTSESAGGPEVPERAIDVWLTLPLASEPRPLVVFSHGMAGHPRKFEALHMAWAEAGFVVAAPVFPLSNDGAQGSFTNTFDVVNQPGDVSFVLDELLARSADPDSDLAGRVDPTRIGAAGLSAGGWTTYQVGLNQPVRDDRISAAVVFAGAFNQDAEFVAEEGLPALIMQGDVDPLISVDVAEAAYASLYSPRYLVVLHGGGHAGPFEDADDAFEPKVDGHDELINASTLAFWDHYLLGIAEAGDELLAVAESGGLATLQADPG
jgi:dienelactone hydrolase